MEIPGTGVYIDKLAWAYAQNANTATVFVRHLLTAVFPTDVLLVSNLRGGNRGGGSVRLPLDKKKVDAIFSMFSCFCKGVTIFVNCLCRSGYCIKVS